MTEGDGIKAKPDVKHNIGHLSNSIALCPKLSSRGQQNRFVTGCGSDSHHHSPRHVIQSQRFSLCVCVSDSRWALETHHTHITLRRVGLLFMHKRLYSTCFDFEKRKMAEKKSSSYSVEPGWITMSFTSKISKKRAQNKKHIKKRAVLAKISKHSLSRYCH